MGTTKKRHLLSVIQKVLITCVMLVVISPFYISIVYALKNKNDLTINRLAWPTHPTLMNFQRVITENDQFLTGYKNSILTTVPVVVLLMLITSMAAYVLARYTTRIYKWIYLIFISGMLIPIQCIMLPFYINTEPYKLQFRLCDRKDRTADPYQHPGSDRFCEGDPLRSGRVSKDRWM